MAASPATRRRVRRFVAPPAVALALIAGAATTTVLPEGAGATPATTNARAHRSHVERGRLIRAWRSTVTHRLHVRGVAYDAGRDQHARSVEVSIYVNGHYRRRMRANHRSPGYDRIRHIHGRHGFDAVLATRWRPKRVRLVVHAAGRGNGAASTDVALVHRRTPDSEVITHVAAKYVGARYRYGANGPHAFDCSGYSRFVYRHAHIAHLPHNAQAQRHVRHMHRISRAAARPGDLVFYLSGRHAYHVAIYAGRDMQYSATDPQQGVQHDRISSRHVIFETDWH